MSENEDTVKLLQEGKISLPIVFDDGKDHSFDETRELFLKYYDYDILPILVDHIRENGLVDDVYGFIYSKTESLYKGQPSAPLIHLSVEGSSEEYIEEMNDYIKENTLLRNVLRRGDLIKNTSNSSQSEDNSGLSIWDGEKALPLVKKTEESYGEIPSEFKTFTEFPLGYFTSEPGLDQGLNVYIDWDPYKEEILSNLVIDEDNIARSWFIAHDLNGDKKVHTYTYLEGVVFDDFITKEHYWDLVTENWAEIDEVDDEDSSPRYTIIIPFYKEDEED